MRYLWLLAFVYPLVVAEPGVFYNPPTGGKIHDYADNPVYKLGQTVQMRWTTTLASFSIMLWQNNNPDYEWVQTDVSDMTSYDWIVSTNQNLTAGDVFFFQVRNASNIEDQDELFASHYFNITENSTATTTTFSTTSATETTAPTSADASAETISTSISLVASSTATATTATTATTHPALSTTKASDATGDNPGKGGLSTNAKIGVGIGAGVGIVLIFAGGLILCLHRRRLKSINMSSSQLPGVQNNQSPDTFPGASKFNTEEPDGKPPPIFEAPMNQKPRIFEAPTDDQKMVFEAPLNEKRGLFELQ
ncbi:hypothetical protein N7456_000781 [Penicillium angulare]|uniref:Mid2 domain-containing protein n=1 Tax=Penicillium angulare TaxID=116970 RepID=A0A9W9KS77_9EURO|nr:hypothetical protein N7456_000781 [Penicillium angulare]